MLTKENSDEALRVWDYQPTIMGITAQNMPKSFKFNIIIQLNQWLRGTTDANQGKIVMKLWRSKTINQL